ncbi:MAG: tRNA pseudouridine(55) synthase TruB [Alphaproteobacteria bacterium]|nr:tRNA pseudouridine(55) synthase TruB [Alphaproteobacteria bacterium]
MADAKTGLDGWLVIDKPVGPSSARIVATVKRLSGASRVGHGGTLDPLASGILPIALGEATKTVRFVMTGQKRYLFTVAFGEARSTDDSEGEVIETSERRPTEAEISAVLDRFRGEIEQRPPDYSAIKVGGQRAYKAARADQPLALAPRWVRVDRLDLIAIGGPDRADFDVVCGKGVYVRALARDLALALGTVGHVAALRRTAVGRFDESAAISLETLERLGHSAALVRHLFPVEAVLDDIPALALTADEANRLRQGQAIRLAANTAGEGLFQTRSDDRLIALAEASGGILRAVRVFNL